MEAYSSFSRKLTKRSITATARIIKLSNEFLCKLKIRPELVISDLIKGFVL